MKVRDHTSMWLLGVLVIAIFTLFFAASISYKQINSLNNSGKWVLHSYKVNLEIEQLRSYVLEAETGQRGFLLSKDSSFLQSYYDSYKKVNQSFANLKELTLENGMQSKELDTLTYLISKRLFYLGNIVKWNVNTENTSDAVKSLLVTGRDIMATSRALVDKMIANEQLVLKSRESEHDEDIYLSPFSLLFIVIFSLVVFIIAYNKINKDLERLTRTNNQLLINNEIFEHSEQIAELSNWRWDVEKKILTFSLNISSLLGCKPEEFENTFENFLKYVHPDDRHIVNEEFAKAFEELTPSVFYFRIIRKDGALRYFKSIGKVITDNYEKIFVIGVNADITEQYRKDKMIEEKIADLERSNKQLIAFNHIASHDLQEPLRKVQTFISRIRTNNFETFPEKVKNDFAGIERSTSRMSNLIEDLLLYSRANKTDKVFEMKDLNKLLENSIQELSQAIEEKGAVIKTLSILPSLNVIPFQIQQLFINIISNSIKYNSPNIPPVIHIDSEKVSGKDIPGSLEDQNSPFYKISIFDNGIGFEQKYAENIFTLFYRLHSKGEYSGTGIGLAICKIIVENHKGYIFAEGIPNMGTTITIFLPA